MADSEEQQRANGKQDKPVASRRARVSKRGVVNEGRPTKATPARIKAILRDIALGLTQERACACNGVHFTTWIDWKNNADKFPELRAQGGGSKD